MMKKELGDQRENGSEDRDAMKTQLPPHEVRGEVDEYDRVRQRGAAARKAKKAYDHLEK